MEEAVGTAEAEGSRTAFVEGESSSREVVVVVVQHRRQQPVVAGGRKVGEHLLKQSTMRCRKIQVEVQKTVGAAE